MWCQNTIQKYVLEDGGEAATDSPSPPAITVSPAAAADWPPTASCCSTGVGACVPVAAARAAPLGRAYTLCTCDYVTTYGHNRCQAPAKIHTQTRSVKSTLLHTSHASCRSSTRCASLRVATTTTGSSKQHRHVRSVLRHDTFETVRTTVSDKVRPRAPGVQSRVEACAGAGALDGETRPAPLLRGRRLPVGILVMHIAVAAGDCVSEIVSAWIMPGPWRKPLRRVSKVPDA